METTTTAVTFAAPKFQQFSLPSTILYYILQSCSPLFYEKINQTCKYFFAKQKLLIAKNVQFQNSSWPTSLSKFNVTNLQNLKSKFWFTGNLVIFDTNHFLNYLIVSKIYQCNIISLAVDSQYIPFNNFLVLISNPEMKHISMTNSMIFDEYTHQMVPVDQIYSLLPNIENFYFSKPSNLHFEIITTKTFTNLIRLTKPDSLNSFKLENFALSPTFDPQAFCVFVELSAAASCAVYTFNVKIYSADQEKEFLEKTNALLGKWSSNNKNRKKPIINMRTNFL